MKKLILLTGPSGAGITSARFVLEESGYYIVEGAPSKSIPTILSSFKKDFPQQDCFCIATSVLEARKIFDILREDKDFEITCIMIIASKNEILKRYALTRHAHPQTIRHNISLEEAIELDAKEAKELLVDVDITIDSTSLTTKELRRQIYNFLEGNKDHKRLTVTFTSFGLKNGLPGALDMFFDVRRLPNPYWVPNLKDLTGKDKEVIDYISSFPETKEYLDEITMFLEKHLSEINKAERVSYNIGVACSGGQHRSTFVAEYLASYFKKEYHTIVNHRDTPTLNE